MATIIEVARLAGVSKSTAARALSGDPHVSEDSRTRVKAAAESLGYTVNRMASALRGGRSRLIGLVVTNLVNASVLKIIEVMEARAQEEGYVVLLGVTEGRPDREAAVVNALTRHGIDGLVIMQSGANTASIDALFDKGLAVVNLIRLPAASHPPAVLADNCEGTRCATRHLLDAGHSRIAYVGGLPETTTGAERFEGFRMALGERGLSPLPALVRRGPFLPHFGVEACRALLPLRDSFSAILVTNHEALFGVLSVLIEERIEIPHSLSLVGFEDVNWFRDWHPALTVVDVDPAAMAEAAFELLLGQINRAGGELPPITRKPTHLLLRGSTAAPRP